MPNRPLLDDISVKRIPEQRSDQRVARATSRHVYIFKPLAIVTPYRIQLLYTWPCYRLSTPRVLLELAPYT
jgi:hypothetical protein